MFSEDVLQADMCAMFNNVWNGSLQYFKHCPPLPTCLGAGEQEGGRHHSLHLVALPHRPGVKPRVPPQAAHDQGVQLETNLGKD